MVRISTSFAVLSGAVDVPNADKANPGGWKNESNSTCGSGSTTTTCSASIDESIGSPSDSDFIQKMNASNSTVDFELTDAPADLVSVGELDVSFRASKGGGKTATVSVEVRKADGTVLGAPTTETLSSTPTNFSYSITGLSLTAADVNGLFVRVVGNVSGTGSSTTVNVQTINVRKTQLTVTRTVFVRVSNEGDHTDSIGVYLDAIPPAGGGCLPSGRILSTIVTLSPGGAVNVFADTGTLGDGLVEFSCTNQSAVVGQTYTLIAAVDVHADDLLTDTNGDLLADCRPGALLSLACGNALADDDTGPPNNRLSRNAPRVQPP